MRWFVPMWVTIVVIMFLAFGTDNDRALEDYLDGMIGDASRSPIICTSTWPGCRST